MVANALFWSARKLLVYPASPVSRVLLEAGWLLGAGWRPFAKWIGPRHITQLIWQSNVRAPLDAIRFCSPR